MPLRQPAMPRHDALAEAMNAGRAARAARRA
jgi:hypothetical protein